MNRKDRRAAQKQGRAGAPGGASAGELASTFAAAVEFHKAGRFLEADGLYRKVLERDPRHVGSLHYLGIVALQTGRPADAIEPIGRALSLNAAMPDAHFNLAFAHQALGRLDQAATHYARALALKPDYVEACMNFGNVLKAQGRLAEAAAQFEKAIALRPQMAQAHYNLGNVLAQQGRLDAAIARLEQALALDPKLAEAHNSLGIALMYSGRLEAAAESHRRALALSPNLAEAHTNLGNVLKQMGRLDEAAAEHERALALRPDHPTIHCNLGTVREAQGRLDDALALYRRALELNPNLIEANNNYGVMLMAQGRLDEAIAALERTLSLKPDFVESLNNLARAWHALGDPKRTLETIARALSIEDNAETRTLFVQAVRNLRVVPEGLALRPLLMRALAEPWGRANDIAPFAACVVKQDPAGEWIRRVAGEQPALAAARGSIASGALAAAGRDELLVSLLQSAPVSDLDLERALTAARAVLLDCATDEIGDGAPAGDDLLPFACALAQQCFVNEYVFARAAAEEDAAARLRDALAKDVAAGAEIAPIRIAIVASYVPLHELAGAETLAGRTWPGPLADLFAQQVGEPLEERALRASLPRLTAIDDAVSRDVQAQYEENPYPRWVKAAPAGRRVGFNEYLRRTCPSAPFAPMADDRAFDILIAGCGTGQHAVEVGRRFPDAKVLAIDLSAASLGYAMRKSRAFGVGNVDYGQADILNLGGIGRTFDLIEASGVLHHLADPFAGWRVLVSLLRPGGFMTVGLYSELARADIVAAREFIAARGFDASAEGIRRCRQALLETTNDDARFRDIVTSGDFSSTSACRDLLFHVQEHRMTLPQIGTFLAESGLTFLGFELDPRIQQHYRSLFPQDRTLTDLAAWAEYERAHPKTFAGMYQLWLQKRG